MSQLIASNYLNKLWITFSHDMLRNNLLSSVAGKTLTLDLNP